MSQPTKREAVCAHCGCRDSQACLDAEQLPCYWIWVNYDTGRGLCSKCWSPDARPCPYPLQGDDGSARHCKESGHCGCDEQDQQPAAANRVLNDQAEIARLGAGHA